MKIQMQTDMAHLDTTWKEIKTEINEINDRMKVQEEKSEDLERRENKIQDMLALKEQTQKENILRFRGIPEQMEEEIRTRMIDILANFLQMDFEELEVDTDQIYRVNSRTARVRSLPRDILIHFVRKRTRDMILQLHVKRLRAQS